ncbi:MAG: hypothetical protein QOH83_1544 [Solirubrobacteraceae bacterium]|jgi:uncharacterized protein involved in type VI secretion and phage assembly|nr:hypothetical protein [Solirubrobacteraceae bacterium]
MPDAMQRRPDSTRDRGTRRVRAAARPEDADVAGFADADADARRLAIVRRAAVTRRADQAALAAAVRDLRSHGRLNHVR